MILVVFGGDMLKTWLVNPLVIQRYFLNLGFGSLILLFYLVLPIPLNAESIKTLPIQEIQQTSGADFWRQIHDGEKGNTSSMGLGQDQLINVHGQWWREVRNQWVSPLGLIFLASSVGGIFLFYLWAGRAELINERTGKKIMRWTPFERAMHWFSAILFILLGISGLLLLYGKHFVMPLMSSSHWGSLMMAVKISHNYLGPLFIASLLCMIVKWFKNNFFNKTDIEWFKQGGGVLPNGKHPDAGFCNGGEKIWFWLIATMGILVCITGLIMDFPLFGQSRELMQIANIIHGLSSLMLIAASFGHIYIGTLGTEGALEGMTTGYVDESWVKQHHKLWYDELNEKPIQSTTYKKKDKKFK